MRRIRHTKTCPFSFWDWHFKNIKTIFAGNSCVMAITQDGKVLQKVTDKGLSAKTELWKNIKSISISQHFPALAVGLKKDGTCIVSEKALKHCCHVTEKSLALVKKEIKDLHHIVEIAVSDAIFALDAFGDVHHIPLQRTASYIEVTNWSGIRHIVTGVQNSVAGITDNGTVVFAGENHSGLDTHLSKAAENDCRIIDLCLMGAECTQAMIALSNGKIINTRADNVTLAHCGKFPVFQNNYLLTAVHLKSNKIKCIPYQNMKDIQKIENASICAISIGLHDDQPFAVYIKE